MLYRDFTTQEAIDRQYDPALSVDAASALQGYREASEAARAALESVQDLAYGPTRAECLDLFPAATAGAPLHVFFHGGYWRALSSKEFAFVARALVPAGVSVAVVNYALCPSVSVTEIVRQCRAALAWLHRHGDRHGYDAGRITVSGHSAGGQIVGMLLATDWSGQYGLPDHLIKAATTISGLFDLAPFPYSWLQPKLQLTGREVIDCSPIHRPPVVACPVSVAVGGRESDEFHRQSRDYLAHLESSGVTPSVQSLTVPDAHHFSVIEGLGTGQGPLFENILAQSRVD